MFAFKQTKHFRTLDNLVGDLVADDVHKLMIAFFPATTDTITHTYKPRK